MQAIPAYGSGVAGYRTTAPVGIIRVAAGRRWGLALWPGFGAVVTASHRTADVVATGRGGMTGPVIRHVRGEGRVRKSHLALSNREDASYQDPGEEYRTNEDEGSFHMMFSVRQGSQCGGM